MARVMKDSGLEILESIPSEWKTCRMKDVCRQAVGKPNRVGTKYVGLEHVSGWTGIATAIDLNNATVESAQHIQAGTICFSKLRPYLAKAFVAETDLLCTGELLGMRALLTVVPRYALYWLLSHRFITAINDGVSGTKMPRVDWATLSEMPFPLPSISQQRRIAAWLDIQTGRIDKRLVLLGNKRELLQELRQGLIDEAMLSGFAGSELVQTGQTALPSMPVHWLLSKFKRRVFFREGPGIMAADFTETGVPLLRIGNIKPGLILMGGCNYLLPEKVERQWRQFKLRLGDIVISASASTGIVSEVGIDAVGAIPYTGLITLRPKSGVSKEYLKFFVISSTFLSQIEEYLKGSTIHHFGPTHLRQMLISVPPVVEQNTIVGVLEKRITRIDAQITLIDQLEQLIKQQRKAVIHDAVTGKIDLSAYVPPQSQVAVAA